MLDVKLGGTYASQNAVAYARQDHFNTIWRHCRHLCTRSVDFTSYSGFFPDILADTEYTDRLELKSASDRTLGVGVIFTDDATLMVLTAATLMKVVIDAEKVVKFQAA